jgi:hypothetical protein
MVVAGGQRLPQLSDSQVVEFDGQDVVRRAIVTDATDADDTGQHQSPSSSTDLSQQGRRIALGHEPLRFLEQQSHALCSGLEGYAVSWCAGRQISRHRFSRST